MNKLDKDYTDLLQDILDNGVKKETRNGGTISVFGRQIRHKMSEGFPLLTTKKMPFKTIVTELLWFLRGDTNIKFLVDNNCHIWDGDCFSNYLKKQSEDFENTTPLNFLNNDNAKEEFINKIKTDDEFAKKWGQLGPIYGKQWRKWIKYENDIKVDGVYTQYSIDQIQNLINDLKTNPDSRRLMVNAWNVGELDQMVLPPCHYGFQVYTRELSLEERCDEYIKRHPKETNDDVLNYKWIGDNLCTHEDYDKWNVPTRTISLSWNQRSVDTFLGLPFNIASYGLLLEMLAKEVNMVPDELIGNLGDAHLYSNHIEQAKEQIGRKLTLEERFELWNNKENEYAMDTYNKLTSDSRKHIFLSDRHQGSVKERTREPFPLPKLVLNPIFLANLEHKGFDEAINGQVNFEVENYQSHAAIPAPLSN